MQSNKRVKLSGGAAAKPTTRGAPAKPSPRAAATNNGNNNNTTSSGQGGSHFPNPPLASATSEEKAKWTGFVERESEPADFNMLLRDWGVTGVKVQEIWSLDGACIDGLGKPILGLLLLQSYHQRKKSLQEPSCPAGVWFANQLAENACSTVSMLNILNNVPAELGAQLAALKASTAAASPVARGWAIKGNSFVRARHNRLARKLQMLEGDWALAADAAAAAAAAAKKSGTKRKASAAKLDHDDGAGDENAPKHYLALVPVDGTVWLLDGMEAQPERVGTYGPNGVSWTDVALATLAEEMGLGLECAAMAIVKDPAISKREGLAANVESLRAIGERLGESRGVEVEGTLGLLGVTGQMLGAASSGARAQLESKTDVEMEDLRGRLLEEQGGLRQDLEEERREEARAEAEAGKQAHDYTGFVHSWLGFLAGKAGVVQALVKSL